MEDVHRNFFIAIEKNSWIQLKKHWQNYICNKDWKKHIFISSVFQQGNVQVIQLLQNYNTPNSAIETNFVYLFCLAETLFHLTLYKKEKALIFRNLNCSDKHDGHKILVFKGLRKKHKKFVSLKLLKCFILHSEILNNIIKFNSVTFLKYNKLSKHKEKKIFILSIYFNNCIINFSNTTKVKHLVQNYTCIFPIYNLKFKSLQESNFIKKIYKLITNCLCIRWINNIHSESLHDLLKSLVIKSYEKIGHSKYNKNNLIIIDTIIKFKNNLEIKNQHCEPWLLQSSSTRFNYQKLFLIFCHLAEYIHSCVKEITKKKLIIRPREIIEILLDFDIYFDVCDNQQHTILHVLAKDNSTDSNVIKILELLLKNSKININAQNKAGNTPLHCAIQNLRNKTKIVELFIKYNADVNSIDFFEHKTPLHLICQQKLLNVEESKKIINILISAGADIDAVDIHGKSPLYTACDTNADIFLEILNQGADISIEYEKDKTILDYFNDYPSRYKCYNVIRDHLLKLTLAGLPVNEKLENLFRVLEPVGTTYLKQIYVDQNHSYLVVDTFLSDCDNELNKMKSILINNNISLYDILFLDMNNILTLVKNDIFRNIINNKNFSCEFSKYGPLLKLKFKKGLSKISLINIAKNKLLTLIEQNIPDLCLENIIKYLNDEDLKYLSRT